MQEQKAVIKSAKDLFERPDVKSKFAEMLGKRAPQFITSVLQVAANNKLLANADPMSIYQCAAVAATLDLPINNNLGFAWIVPYNGQAQFQVGAKGYKQLAMRTGQYTAMNVVSVYANQFTSFDALTEELEADFKKFGEGEIVGYAAYFQMVNGFKKVVYWPKEKVLNHAKRFSKSFGNGPWKTDFDKMAQKTVIKNMLAEWGMLSVEIQTAVIADQSVIRDAETLDIDYVDNDGQTETTSHEDLAALYEMKKAECTADEQKDFERILEKKETNSYQKIFKILSEK